MAESGDDGHAIKVEMDGMDVTFIARRGLRQKVPTSSLLSLHRPILLPFPS